MSRKTHHVFNHAFDLQESLEHRIYGAWDTAMLGRSHGCVRVSGGRQQASQPSRAGRESTFALATDVKTKHHPPSPLSNTLRKGQWPGGQMPGSAQEEKGQGGALHWALTDHD